MQRSRIDAVREQIGDIRDVAMIVAVPCAAIVNLIYFGLSEYPGDASARVAVDWFYGVIVGLVCALYLIEYGCDLAGMMARGSPEKDI